ncbi:MAG: thioredoxin domain-containing protein, partial [Candidatus Binatia bacterium]
MSLDRMCRGGLYDQLGGGFARYAVDDQWRVPHFEKMLYDNAQLLELLALEYSRTRTARHRLIAHETVNWLAREMTTPEGAFAASLNADSEGEEGAFYVWSQEEIADLIGENDAAFFAKYYDVTAAGNFGKKNVLNRLSAVAASETDEARLAPLRDKLLRARQERIRPNLDDKVLADWNGLMIASLVNAGIIFDAPTWIEMASRAFDFISRAMTKGDQLGHAWRAGRLVFPGLASDLASMIRASLALYEQTAKRRYLEQALKWQRALDRYHSDETIGQYLLTADNAKSLVVRLRATADDAMPNYNAVAAQNLVRLAVLSGEVTWKEKADRLFDSALPNVISDPFAHIAM